MAIIAVMVLMLAAGQPTSFESRLMLPASEAYAVAWAIALHSRWPGIFRILAITKPPSHSVGPAVSAVIVIVYVPRRRVRK